MIIIHINVYIYINWLIYTFPRTCPNALKHIMPHYVLSHVMFFPTNLPRGVGTQIRTASASPSLLMSHWGGGRGGVGRGVEGLPSWSQRGGKCIHVYIYAYIHVQMYTFTNVCMYTCMHLCKYVYVYTFFWCMHLQTHWCMHWQMYIWVNDL